MEVKLSVFDPGMIASRAHFPVPAKAAPTMKQVWFIMRTSV
jgi:hypothetical protein